ncbi:unnamed protein product [Urochloa decumbens]|uniref:RBR-type E3 ubiquitin transferase n=1 Tax=Urochloa decumbens TaxID=240449 RepID=A0ABC9D2G6_9POAL
MESPRAEREPSPEAAAVSRELAVLREMMLRARREGEEPQVPDEQLRSNDQLQYDEMLALEAIYGENIHIFGEKAGLRSFKIHVHCEIPDGVSVSAELFQCVDGDDDLKNQSFDTFSVQHLPPMSLTCLMPLSYPSHRPPYFTLSVQWLDSVKISSLCHILDSIWTQQPGQEIVYEWVQWLQGYALSHVGFGDGIIIRQSNIMMSPVDVRAVAEIVSVESVVQSLISYNEEQCHESFLSGLHDCMICLSEHAGTDFIKLPCLHYYCRRCMETYSRMHVKEGTVMKLLCPDDKCQGVIPPNLLKRLLGDADFERWERLILERTLDSMVDVTYCPRCETACLEDEENNAQCSKCFFSFCTLCRERRHTGVGCTTPEEKLLSLQEREKDGKSDLSQFVNELVSIREALRDAVQCPHCDMAISRVSGCNYMHCRNCGNGFCYDCRATLDTHRVHLCELEEEQKSVRQADLVEQIEKEVAAQAQRFRNYPCPSCGQQNPKVGNNNHMFCWACQVHYCVLCRKVVRKSSEHYGPRGCKQHTVDPDIPQQKDNEIPQKNDNETASAVQRFFNADQEGC